MEPKVIVITGPTCSGKTPLSINLAQKLNSEIISADSRQIYKYLDIGTAKPSKKELRKIRHHFIDVLSPDEEYNVSRFESEGLRVIRNLLKKNFPPIVAGGSGLYIKALVDGIFDSAERDEEYREELLEIRRIHGNEYLHDLLKKIDHESADKMLPQNWKRIIRALEVYHLTGEPIGVHQARHKREIDVKFVQFGLRWKREILYKNIEERVDRMMNEGLVEETRSIMEKGFDPGLNSLNTVGYKEIISYLEGSITIERAVELIKRNTRRFAKRQLTWFRADERIIWFDINSKKDLEKISGEIVKIEETK